MSSGDSIPKLKWPRAVETDPRLGQLEAFLNRDQRPLWEKGTILVGHASMTKALEKTLLSLNGLHQLERGLEGASDFLNREQKGLSALHAKQGTQPANRMSRLLIIGEGGSERFYRGCEKLLRDFSDRVLGVRLDVTDAHMLERLYGPDALAKALLISHRDAVTRALWAMLE